MKKTIKQANKTAGEPLAIPTIIPTNNRTVINIATP